MNLPHPEPNQAPSRIVPKYDQLTANSLPNSAHIFYMYQVPSACRAYFNCSTCNDSNVQCFQCVIGQGGSPYCASAICPR